MSHVRPFALGLISLCAFQRSMLSFLGIQVPDLTIAAIFLVGYVGWSPRVVAILLLTVCGLDLAEFALGQGADCMSPAYPLIVPAYLSMWVGGRVARDHGFGTIAASYAIACVLAFMVSSGGWYLFSSRFPHATLSGFVPRITTYLPGHLLHHGVLGLAGIVFTRGLRGRAAERSELVGS